MLKKILALGFYLSMSICVSANAFSEDSYLMMSSDAFNRGDFAAAKDGYLTLYQQTKNISYAKEAAISAANMGDLQTAAKLALLYQNTTKNTNDLPTNKILVDTYMKMGDTKKAISLLENIKKQEDSLPVNNVLGTLYLSEKNFDKAFSLLDNYYNQTHDEEALGKLLMIYFTKNNPTAALNLLKSHLQKYGCTDQLCQKSIDIFARLNDIADAEKIFQKIYENSPTVENARYLIWILASQKKYKQAQDIAQKFPLNRHLLLELYVVQKNFSAASKQAGLIYQEKENPKYLALEAIYLFQSLKNPKINQIKTIAEKLEKSIKERKKEIISFKENLNSQDAFFYNFLGYMLIDYDVDIKKGIEYVKMALDIDPSSISYVDSLAWGYYKLGKCAEAKKIFATIPDDQIQAEPELKSHFESIGACQK
ncbi:tetratricopeptide repeat protein [Helicobacter cappadocius]|uniref:ATP-dependent nuclease subunit B n=1 Tax=Helicobacter cappadocius TaxID=3063998 RepID=A0AA90SRT4_9HELI|nr:MULTISPECIES: ATP-dependent nuclease subunit B [unclassified Helicobacter]MDO7252307.1 ATP-dependent nuclease subunit B [Helicobacter sp. faydin-H75]MDP2538174.1 ATP-dependent nuclease subunit B [Helicobacter sp. faydin-H76]